MQAGQRIKPEELAAVARAAFEKSGKTQTEAASEMGVTQPAFAQAINEPKRSLDKLRIAIIERYSGFEVEGPEYQLKQK